MSAREELNPVRGGRTIYAALLTLLLALALSAPVSAEEIPNHAFKEELIGGVIDPDQKPPVSSLEAPCGVAVSSTGTLYVSDFYRASIGGLPGFNPAGNPCGLATAPFNVFLNYWHAGVANAVTGMIDPGPATGIAIDPATNDLYVNHRTSIAVYAAPIEPGEPPSSTIDPGPEGSLIDGYGVAVSSFPATAGLVYVPDAGDRTVKVYDPKVSLTVPVKVIDGAGTPTGHFVSLVDASLTIDQTDGHIFVVDNTQPGFEHPQAAVYEFNAEGLYRGQLEHELVHGEPTGITVNESITPANGEIYVTSGNGTSFAITPPQGIPLTEMGSLYAFDIAGEGKTLTVTRSGAGAGSVMSDPAGIACPGSCKAEFNRGATVILTAAPASGSAFAGWSGACSGTGTCQVDLNAVAAVNAQFISAPAALSIGSVPAAAAAGTPAGPPAPGGSALRLGRTSSLGPATVVVHAGVPAAGTLSASGSGLQPATTTPSGAGSTTLRLHLNHRGRNALDRSKTGRLSMRVAVSFTPNDGAPASVVGKTVTFKTAK